ncbi:hypothetical protein SLS60_003195 [Paraconiothyrium brasiliense]|uniref:Uncharacterized protein n=1 Tax=Paraconiothyrium brasiliense TaxID=300254 RepID=A0ABR3RUZ1_9PLEO
MLSERLEAATTSTSKVNQVTEMSKGTIEDINKLRKKAGYNIDFSAGRRTGIEIISDEQARELWLEDELKELKKSESPVQGVKHFDIKALVEEINNDMDEGAVEKHKREIKEIQAMKQEAYMNPDRLAMIQGGWEPFRHEHGSHRPGYDRTSAGGREKVEEAEADAARKQDIRECPKCFRLRRQNRRNPICDEHRNSHDNVLTDVPLCPHIDMRLFWYASDPANKKDSWFFDVTDVHAHDLHAHEACKGSIKSVMDGIDEVITQVSKTMDRRNLRAPTSVSRLIRQLPGVLYLEEVDDDHVETVKKVDEAKVKAYAKQLKEKMSAWDMKMAKIRASQQGRNVVTKEAMKPMKTTGNANEPKNRFQLSKTEPKKAKPATEEPEASKSVSGQFILQQESMKANFTSKQSDTVKEKKASKRKASNDIDVSSGDEKLQEPPTKKIKASTKKVGGNETAQQPTSDIEAITSDDNSPEAGKPSSPATELSTRLSQELFQNQATEDIAEGPQNTTEQLAFSKKRKTSSNEEFETGHVSIKKRKVSIDKEEKTETVTDNASTVTSALEAEIFETMSDANPLPTPSDTDPATPDAEAPSSVPKLPSLSLDTTGMPSLTSSSSRRSSTDSQSSEKSSESMPSPKEAADKECPKLLSPKVSVTRQFSTSAVGDSESIEDEVDYDSGDE